MKNSRDPAIYPVTPDGRYFVVKERLWRKSNPGLSKDEHEKLVKELMRARREVGKTLKTSDGKAEHTARLEVDRTKQALGERGPVWWEDGAPDLNRYLVKNTPYADWYSALKT